MTPDIRMANTYSSLFYHIVFSTKHRKNWIEPKIENRVWAYIGGVARTHRMSAIQVGGIEDHAHVLVMAKPVISPSQIAQHLKGESSKWVHQEFENMKTFAWQDGYGAFSVSKSKVPDVIDYIKNQREHHATESFEEEYERLMTLHGVEFDAKYLLD
ncbi:MAG TPA: IS200/IS605 family transposase [Pyrinomonadaceae bacterium]|nr:IS200/IS605 family transposase [Pyrinomonadaceae bacterium]